MMNRAAIVIGVNKTGKLPVLRSAASGAKRFGDWLAGEGFYVHVFVDDQNSVKARPIFEKIMRLVEKGTLDQLVVYFSGHGFLRGYSEYWMLSEAPLNPNEAISVRESIELARRCGIPNVIFVSDACRSAPQSIDAASVKGSLIFPSNEVVDTFPPEVDQFYAALPGKPAFVTVVGESAARHEGIFTHCFLLAYSHPDNNMIHKVKDNSETIYVVPNRKLKKYLYREVREILRKKNFSIDQLPETRVESGENVYIGRVTVKGVKIKKKDR
ncbi:caspase family protein, partial [bacterium]|nr:caspase family protein [bacterium]